MLTPHQRTLTHQPPDTLQCHSLPLPAAMKYKQAETTRFSLLLFVFPSPYPFLKGVYFAFKMSTHHQRTLIPQPPDTLQCCSFPWLAANKYKQQANGDFQFIVDFAPPLSISQPIFLSIKMSLCHQWAPTRWPLDTFQCHSIPQPQPQRYRCSQQW